MLDNIVEKLSKGSDFERFRDEYQSMYALRFHVPLVGFVDQLRNYSFHHRVVLVPVQFTRLADSLSGESDLVARWIIYTGLVEDELYHGERGIQKKHDKGKKGTFSQELAAQYLKEADDCLEVKVFVDAYYQLVADFHGWMRERGFYGAALSATDYLSTGG
jgi:hypothetical protein